MSRRRSTRSRDRGPVRGGVARRAAPVALLAALVAACGESAVPPPSAPPPPPDPEAADVAAAPGPDAAPIDDVRTLAAVVAAASRGGRLASEFQTLPPRVSPVRVGVRALHDHLLGVQGSVADWNALLVALDGLAGASSKADAGVLGPLVARWRLWTPAHREAEAALALRSTRALDVLRSPDPIDLGAFGALLTALPAAPPGSPAHASIAVLGACRTVLDLPAGPVTPAANERLIAARQQFVELGWPGGAGVVLDHAAARAARDPDASRAALLANLALDSYRASGDSVRVAQLLLDLAGDARRRGEIERAESLAATAEETLAAASVRGPEPADAAFFRAQMLQALGRHDACLDALDRVLREIDVSQLDPAQRVRVLDRRATSLFVLARYDEALAAADRGLADFEAHVRGSDPATLRRRADLEELAGEALVELGRGREGAERHLRASERHAALPGGDAAAASSRLLAARALSRGGDREGAVRLVERVLGAAGVTPTLRAQAAAVLRDAGALDAARREIDRAASEGGPRLAEALTEERARLEAAAGRRDEARALFAAAERRATRGVTDRPGGFAAGRVVLDWARMELDAGDLEAAIELADRAVHHLSDGAVPTELDRAQELYVAVSRRAGIFGNAERVAAVRIGRGVPGSAARRLDAQLDLFLVRLERASAGGDGAAARLSEAIAALPEGPARAAATAISHPGSGVPPASPGESPRVALLREAAALHDADPADLVAFARRVPATEPEIRRWALTCAVTPRPGVGARRVDVCVWSDLRRGADPVDESAVRSVLADDEAFVVVEPVGAWTRLAWLLRDGGGERAVPGDVGLVAFWDAVRVEPAPDRLDAAGRALLAAGFRDVLRECAAAGVRRITFSLPASYGSLPFDAVPWSDAEGERPLMEVFAIAHAASASERVAASELAPPAPLAALRSRRAPLTARFGVVALAAAPDAARDHLLAAARARIDAGEPAWRAVWEVKRAMRTDPAFAGDERSVPPWASFGLRGAP